MPMLPIYSSTFGQMGMGVDGVAPPPPPTARTTVPSISLLRNIEFLSRSVGWVCDVIWVMTSFVEIFPCIHL